MIWRALVFLLSVQLYCCSEMKTPFYIVNNFVVGFVGPSGNEIVGHFFIVLLCSVFLSPVAYVIVLILMLRMMFCVARTSFSYPYKILEIFPVSSSDTELLFSFMGDDTSYLVW